MPKKLKSIMMSIIIALIAVAAIRIAYTVQPDMALSLVIYWVAIELLFKYGRGHDD